MSTSVTLNEQSIVCRTCLKVLDTTGFTYIDDESAYVKNVGNIREMLQFCIPELDLYVSSQPAICNQCLTILVQVYNFKIKCLNGENTIKAYITRNNLQEYNHVNLNCVLMDDLRMKSQKIQIESRIKHMMLKEIPDNDEATINRPQQSCESQQIMKTVNHDEAMDSYNIILTDSATKTVSQANEQEDLNDKEMKIEISETDDAIIDDTGSQNHNNESDANDSLEEEEEENYFDENVESVNNEPNNEKQMNIVAVRKDLFDNQSSQSSVEEPTNQPKDQPPTLILNNGILPQNGRIVIKIERKKLQSMSVAPNENKPSSSNSNETSEKSKPSSTPPPLTALEVPAISSSSEELSTPQMITVETVDGCGEKQTVYNCNKCSFVTSDVIKMYDHNRTSHSFDYTCQHCPFSTSKVELLGKHMTMVHPQNMMAHRSMNFKVTENYACTLCPFSVKNIDLLRSHHLSAHGNADGEKGPIVLNSAFTEVFARNEPRILKRLEYTCDVCPYSTRDKSNLRKHLFTHGTKPLKCEHCTYKCVSPYQLRRHQKQKHAKHLDPRPRNQPYKLPDFKKENREAMDSFKITLESIKREIEKELST